MGNLYLERNSTSLSYINDIVVDVHRYSCSICYRIRWKKLINYHLEDVDVGKIIIIVLFIFPDRNVINFSYNLWIVQSIKEIDIQISFHGRPIPLYTPFGPPFIECFTPHPFLLFLLFVPVFV